MNDPIFYINIDCTSLKMYQKRSQKRRKKFYRMDSDSRIFPIRSLLASKDSTTPSDVSKTSLESTSPPIKVSENDLFVWSNGQFVHCDQEPIHIPGCIQSFGALIAITTDTWQVVLASENTFQIIQIDVFELLKADSFKEFITYEQALQLQRHFEGLNDYPDEAGPVVLSFEFKNSQKAFYCACHKSIKNPGMYILEFELEQDDLFPLNVTNDESPTSFPVEVLNLVSKSLKKSVKFIYLCNRDNLISLRILTT